MKEIPVKLFRRYKLFVNRLKYTRIFWKFQPFTMLSPHSYIRNLCLVERFRHIDGIVVECGVWKGGTIAGIAELLGAEREYYLFDSFAGIPAPQEIDGQAALQWQQDKDSPHYHDNCRVSEDVACEAMARAGAKHFHTMKGFFEETLPQFCPQKPIAILRLDADWYDSTMLCLQYLYPYIAEGGVIILDDYYTFDGCARAVHDFLSARSLTERVHQFEHDVCFLVKRSPVEPVEPLNSIPGTFKKLERS
ncbi:Macrocin O-methyltransferase [Tumidithrix helvetica PCC 7403]|uniref:TylF/MycF/NovP-related O-methyltransferase n=1 Tax=Tumidithrix helvetica TaxID=3457545 RepID=UPI003CA1A749